MEMSSDVDGFHRSVRQVACNITGTSEYNPALSSAPLRLPSVLFLESKILAVEPVSDPK